jgi:hypothetical protein
MNRNLIFAPVLVQVLLTLMGKGLRPLYPPFTSIRAAGARGCS